MTLRKAKPVMRAFDSLEQRLSSFFLKSPFTNGTGMLQRVCEPVFDVLEQSCSGSVGSGTVARQWVCGTAVRSTTD
jgi:hypothetical protein